MSFFTGSAQPGYGDNEIDLLRKWAQSAYLQTQGDDIPTVANAAARLSLPANTPVGYQVFQIDNSTVYQLAAPDTSQGGVFVSGGTQDGVYTDNHTIQNGRASFSILGQPAGNDPQFTWNGDDRWLLNNGDPVYYSLSDVASPDLASNWKNASDDSPASITVTSVSQGDLASGFKIGSVTYSVNGNSNGRNQYPDVLGVADAVSWNGTKWVAAATNINLGNVAFPWQGTPAVSVVQSNVAAEANWNNI